jgi:hypothetical protein
VSRYYTWAYNSGLFTGTTDFLILRGALNRPARLVKVAFSQGAGATHIRDANEKIMGIQIRRLGPTVSGGGSGAYDRKVDTNDDAALVDGTQGATSYVTTDGTNELLDTFDWNVRERCVRVWDKGFRPNLINGQALVVRLTSWSALGTFKVQGVYEEV